MAATTAFQILVVILMIIMEAMDLVRVTRRKPTGSDWEIGVGLFFYLDLFAIASPFLNLQNDDVLHTVTYTLFSAVLGLAVYLLITKVRVNDCDISPILTGWIVNGSRTRFHQNEPRQTIIRYLRNPFSLGYFESGVAKRHLNFSGTYGAFKGTLVFTTTSSLSPSEFQKRVTATEKEWGSVVTSALDTLSVSSLLRSALQGYSSEATGIKNGLDIKLIRSDLYSAPFSLTTANPS